MEEIFNRVYLGNTVKAYLIVLAGIFIVRGALALIRKFLIGKLKKLADSTNGEYDDAIVVALDKFVVPLVYLNINIQIIRQLNMSAKLHSLIDVIQLVVIVYYIIRMINFAIVELLRLHMVSKGENVARMKQLNGVLNILKALIWIIGILFVLGNRGVDIRTFIAGLGVGGIAIALAAQNILGDVFNYFVIFFDKPFEVGDFVAFGTNSGTIENIGIKTTRLASINGQQLVVSNSVLTGQVISNYKRMPKRRVVFQIGVEYSTPADIVEKIPSMLEEIIKKDDILTFDRAHLLQFGASSIDYEIVYYVPGANYNTYMDVHQRICFDIYRAFEKAGIGFAFPSQTLYIEKNRISFVGKPALVPAKENPE